MDESNENIDFAKATAFYAYLELCNATNEVPRKEIYNLLNKSTSSLDLEKATTFMELEEDKYLAKVKDLHESKQISKQSLLSKVLDIFK